MSNDHRVTSRLLIATLATLCLAGCSGSEASNAPMITSTVERTKSELAKKFETSLPRTWKLGETATVRVDNKYGGEVKVTISDFTQIDGGMFRASVVIETVSGRPHYNALDFNMLTAEGGKVQRANESTLTYGELYEGEKVVGDLVFNPAGGTPTTIYYAPNFDRLASWKLD